ncbi:uncharacterized protein LOC118801726 isoform X2 [Colossoma macropomum]|uniref:uncharacterized protein LOC118801726 isoform X2 n=1 Tax=Colossoma macropomum TaxID=42526 RepID=UPI0018655419|nr:uncharacterized protein LOC118801726 isoform X2 [Colossoma macropomum]
MGQQEEQLRKYILETLSYIKTAKNFCDAEQQWTTQRKTELKKMRDIKSRAGEFLGCIRKQELENELGAVLGDTLEGLKKLHHFLDAVERLAVTSLFVFVDKSFLLEGVNTEAVRSVISAARTMSPLLIHFKRDDRAFFMPRLGNVDVLAFQLDKYVLITQQLCKRMKSKSTLDVIDLQDKSSSRFNFTINGSMKNAIGRLSKIRVDESFRMSFLFNGKGQRFSETYRGRRSRMFRFLSDLEETAVKLDRMKMGSSISTVAGSSVGIAGSILSIVGLALAPVTAGTSLALTLTGVGLGVTSGVTSLVTGITEMAVNSHHGANANNVFQRFMEDVQMVLDCLEQAARRQRFVPHLDEGNTALGSAKAIIHAGTVSKGIDALVDGASAMKALKTEEVARTAVSMGLQEAKAARNIPNLAADLPDIGRLAKGTPLAMTKAARAGFITLNALFIGIDVLFICKEGVSLAKGEKSEVSQLIRSRSALWRSELEAWDRIHDRLCKGKETFQDNLEILQQSFSIIEMIRSQMNKWHSALMEYLMYCQLYLYCIWLQIVTYVTRP